MGAGRPGTEIHRAAFPVRMIVLAGVLVGVAVHRAVGVAVRVRVSVGVFVRMLALVFVGVAVPGPVGVLVVMAVAVLVGMFALMLVGMAMHRAVVVTMLVLVALYPGFALPAAANCTHDLSRVRRRHPRRNDKLLILGAFACR
jgi:hypothetical protein